MMEANVAEVLQRALTLNNELTEIIRDMAVPARLGKAVMEDDQCFSFSEASKMLSPKLKEETGNDIGSKRLFSACRDMRILSSDPNHWNEPYQEYVHHFKLVPKETDVGIKLTPLFTGKGLAWILPKLIRYYK